MTFKPEGIVVHCSATKENWMANSGIARQRTEIKRWHVVENGWRDIGYAKLFGRKGDTALGRDLDGDGDVYDDIGAHTKGWNRKAIGLCLIGGFGSNADDKFSDHFTQAQDRELRREIAMLRDRFPSIKWVKGHNQFANKACPGFDVPRWYNKVPAYLGGTKVKTTHPLIAALTALLKLLKGLKR